MVEAVAASQTTTFGIAVVVLGALALFGMVIHLYARPLCATNPCRDLIAETANNIREAAKNLVAGGAPAAAVWSALDMDDILRIIIGILGASAVVLGLVGYLREENVRPTKAAIGLGIGVLLLQFMASLAFAMIGAFFIRMILENLDGILPGT